MTDQERQLLLMVAKDMRRIWGDPDSVADVYGLSKHVAEDRARQYDHTIHEVEKWEKMESHLRNRSRR